MSKITNNNDDRQSMPLKPHLARRSGNWAWYTPATHIEAARQAMGSND
jgi:hypothetical protein